MTEHSKKQFKQQIYQLGICPGDTVLVHSSYKSLGGIEDGAAGLFEAFSELLGDKGTILLPSLSYSTVTWENPFFDRQNTPSCVGFLPEFFRTCVTGVVRSMHATHSCCAKGKYADELTAEHELDLTPVGVHSPFYKIREIGGKILFLGCSPDHNTSMHGVEETAEPFYLFDRSKRIHYYLKDKERVIEQDALRHNFIVDGQIYDQRYSRIIPLLDGKSCHNGKVLDAECWLFSADAVWTAGKKKLQEDPGYFVEKV